jgi:hypothetical protein
MRAATGAGGKSERQAQRRDDGVNRPFHDEFPLVKFDY